MAGSDDGGLSAEMEAVSQNINGFSDRDIDVDEAMGNTLEALSCSVSKKMGVPWNLAHELNKLEADVDSLESNITRKKEHLKQVKQWLRNDEENDEPKSIEKMDKSIQHLEDLIHRIQKLTGVTVEDYEEDEVNKDEKSTQKHYNIAGKCNAMEFGLEFDTEELGGEQTEMSIKEFHAFVTQDVCSEIEKPLERVVNDQNIEGFFRLIMPYSIWDSHRQNLLNHFAEKYPDFVTVYTTDTSRVLVISHPQSKHGPVLTISWEFSPKTLDRVTPRIRLGVECTKQILKLDKSKALETAPENFELLMEEFGIERAVDIMVRLVQQQTDH